MPLREKALAWAGPDDVPRKNNPELQKPSHLKNNRGIRNYFFIETLFASMFFFFLSFFSVAPAITKKAKKQTIFLCFLDLDGCVGGGGGEG